MPLGVVPPVFIVDLGIFPARDTSSSIDRPSAFGYESGMAFRVKKGEVNHMPEWYEEHGCDEDSPPSIRALLLADMKTIGADIDSTLTPGELLENYRESWKEVLSDSKSGNFPKGMLEVMNAEASKLFEAPAIYERPPFTTLGRVMDEGDLDEDDVLGYLRWRVRQRKTEERRAKRRAEEEAKAKIPHKFFTSETDPKEVSPDDV